MTHYRLALAAAVLASVSPLAVAAQTVERVANGVVVTPASGPAKRVRILVYGEDRFRVTATPEETLELPDSLMVTARPGGDFTVEEAAGTVRVKAAAATAEVRLADGHVRFLDRTGKPVLDEAARGAFRPVTIEGKAFLAVQQQFNRGTDEGFFGLGQHQNRQMNYNGEDVELAQHNMDIAVPFLVSTKGYGVLWDANSITRFGNPTPYAPTGKGLNVTSGGAPGWTAQYYLGDKLAVTQREPEINYEYLRDQAKWPAAAKARTERAGESGQNIAGNAVETQKVVWTGTLHPTKSGVHKFRLYASSYVKLSVDGREVFNRWRQNWNPWFHNFELPLTAGKAAEVKIEWEPNAGYIAFYHNDPLPDPDRHSLWLSSEAVRALDYYFVGGGTPDRVIAGYRALTGKAEMMPKWAYGFWQSRQRYETADQLTGVVDEYRRRGIPLDNIVLDWRYWTDPSWGSHEFDAARFPSPEKMVEKVHAQNARIMISVWPKFYPTTENGKALDAKGWLYRRPLEAGQKDWVGPGYANTYYNPYVKGARDLYFQQIRDKLVSKGFDAWWMDATEPDWHSNLSVDERKYQMSSPLHDPGAVLFNSYPLVHSEGLAENLRKEQPERRPFILTRSGFAGTQRTSSALWSGDVAARWDDLRDQISAGVNLSMSGIPNWTHDIGGFALEDRYTNQEPAHLAEWRELNLRWFQFGAFSPLFRSHGETPKREIYEIARDDKAMYDAMVAYTRLRYRLMPYIYTIAADTWHKDGTILRGLAMDFPTDRKGWNVDDEYMFGPAFLVAPVTEFNARSRPVYLPAGTGWYDWNTGAFAKGGQTIAAAAPRERLPLFVRAGSIVPTGPDIQWTGQDPGGAIVLHVFTGADGSFSLYEDDGLSPDYKRGAFARVPIRWDEAAGTLTIGVRQGSFAGMPATRALSVRFHTPEQAVAPDFAPNAAVAVTYDGSALTVRRR
ncbi:TIM-barrel domain-containing protein [Sphingomonas hengshuiensis]|uniref:Alpha-xylosidase n=1 Tax=Sphingomonas hengshuiensis TaxID=1609977 RepID=A0A7U4LF41_9SPHN|nr:TIM-barrel domain-containing protein [Sphingomonas hengshuiensis]AJP72087.1 alpha-xylosidase [Sphingomonas hengshuiensis]